jgi:hypothetical protein
VHNLCIYILVVLPIVMIITKNVPLSYFFLIDIHIHRNVVAPVEEDLKKGINVLNIGYVIYIYMQMNKYKMLMYIIIFILYKSHGPGMWVKYN